MRLCSNCIILHQCRNDGAWGLPEQKTWQSCDPRLTFYTSEFVTPSVSYISISVNINLLGGIKQGNLNHFILQPLWTHFIRELVRMQTLWLNSRLWHISVRLHQVIWSINSAQVGFSAETFRRIHSSTHANDSKDKRLQSVPDHRDVHSSEQCWAFSCGGE